MGKFSELLSLLEEGYQKSNPFDMFAQSKLLKLVARVSKSVIQGWAPRGLDLDDVSDEYEIDKIDRVNITVSSVEIRIHNEPYVFSINANNINEYTLVVHINESEVITVFDKRGQYTIEFMDFVDSKNPST
jgi:hypothetical protein